METLRRINLLSLLFCLLSTTLLSIGISIPNWNSANISDLTRQYKGLWLSCLYTKEDADEHVEKRCKDITYEYRSDSGEASFLWTSQGLMATGLGTALVACILYARSTYHPCPNMTFASAIFSLLTGIMTCVGVTLFACGFLLRVEASLVLPNGWGFWLACVGSGGHLIQGIVLLIQTDRKGRSEGLPCYHEEDEVFM